MDETAVVDKLSTKAFYSKLALVDFAQTAGILAVEGGVLTFTSESGEVIINTTLADIRTVSFNNTGYMIIELKGFKDFRITLFSGNAMTIRSLKFGLLGTIGNIISGGKNAAILDDTQPLLDQWHAYFDSHGVKTAGGKQAVSNKQFYIFSIVLLVVVILFGLYILDNVF